MKFSVSKTQFLSELYKGANGELSINLRLIDTKGISKNEFIKVNELNRLDEVINPYLNTYNCYFGVALRKDQTSGKKENCAQLTCLFVDVDYGTKGHKKNSVFQEYEQALNFIENFPIKPTFIIHSGNGFHLYWKLKTPIDLDKESIVKVELVLKKLSKAIGGDSTHNVDRILRIPGTYNLKSNEKKECIVFNINDSIYEYEEFVNQPILNLGLENINDIELLKLIFGINNQQIEDRSRLDEKILYRLVEHGFNQDAIKAIFDFYPTTGKYLERKRNDIKGAEQYLNHSIRKACEFYNTNISNPAVKTIYNQDNEHVDDYINIYGDYYFHPSGNNIGYYKKTKKGLEKMTNFILTIQKQYKDSKKEQTVFFDGFIKLANKKFSIKQIDIKKLMSKKDIEELASSVAGVEALVFSSDSQLTNVIKQHNANVGLFDYVDYGYNEDFTCYYTNNLIIKNTGELIKSKNPIYYSDDLGEYDIGFNYDETVNINDVIYNALKIILLDNEKVIYTALSAIPTPIVIPKVNDLKNSRPYLMYVGPSGCGKTTLIKLLHAFYFCGDKITSWTSTPTALTIVGHAFKNVLFCIDDLKQQNFMNERDIERAMSFIQNYSDGTSRDRATVDLKLKEPKDVRGFIVMSGEDLVFTESSTVARGVFVNMVKKGNKSEFISELFNCKKYFGMFTIELIKFVMKDNVDYNKKFSEYVEKLEQIALKKNYEGPNLPRLIKNIACLMLNFDVIYRFLQSKEKHIYIQNIKAHEDQIIEELFDENYKRIVVKRPELKLLKNLFELVTNDQNRAWKIDNSLYENDNALLVYSVNDAMKTYQIGIKNITYKIVNEYLRTEGGLGNSYDTIVKALIQNNLAYSPGSGRVLIGLSDRTKIISGFLLNVELPDEIKTLLGIPLEYQIVLGKNDSPNPNRINLDTLLGENNNDGGNNSESDSTHKQDEDFFIEEDKWMIEYIISTNDYDFYNEQVYNEVNNFCDGSYFPEELCAHNEPPSELFIEDLINLDYGILNNMDDKGDLNEEYTSINTSDIIMSHLVLNNYVVYCENKDNDLEN